MKFSKICGVIMAALILLSILPEIASAEVKTGNLPLGSYVQLGEYYGQDILWKVINNDQNGSTILSDEIISLKMYDAWGDAAENRDDGYRKTQGSNYWEKSNIREWLNSDNTKVNWSHQKPDKAHELSVVRKGYDTEPGFLNGFSEKEKGFIQAIKHKAILAEIDSSVKEGGTEGYYPSGTGDKLPQILGNYDNAYFEMVEDKVFLLSAKEVNDYLNKNNIDARARISAGVKANDPEPDENAFSTIQYWPYWLRTPVPHYGDSLNIISCASDNNEQVILSSENAAVSSGVRPALVLKKELATEGDGSLSNPYIIVGDMSTWAVEMINKAEAYDLLVDDIMSDYQEDITRVDFCKLVVKMYEALSEEEAETESPNPFTDTQETAVLKAYKLGIVKGKSADKFAPQDRITRQEISVMFSRAIKVIRPSADFSIEGASVFSDEAQIASWALDSVKFANKNGIIKGMGNNAFAPLGNATREQAVVLVVRVYEKYVNQ